MRINLLATLMFGVLVTFVGAQGPLHDKVLVTLPHPVTIQDTVLQPGAYEIRQMQSSSGNNRILHIFSDSGMKLETTAMTISTVDNKTPEDTKVVLHRIADGYYFDKIWIEGKNYGYEFVLPDAVRSRESERKESTSLTAKYEPVQQTEPEQTAPPAQTSPQTAQAEQPAQSERPIQTAQVDQNAQKREEADRIERERLDREEKERNQRAQADAKAEQDRLAQAERDKQAQAEKDTLAQADRDRQAQEQAESTRLAQNQPQASPSQTEPATMPDTSLNWLGSLLAGGALSGLSLALRRRR